MRNSIVLGVIVNTRIFLLVVTFLASSSQESGAESKGNLTPSQKEYLQKQLGFAKRFSIDPKVADAHYEGIDATTAKCVESDSQITPIFASPGKGIATFEIACGKRVTYKLRIESIGERKVYRAYVLPVAKKN